MSVSPSPGTSAASYLNEVYRFPMLEAALEQDLCRRWRDHHDVSAADQLVRSHLRLVVKVASGYRGYGLPSDELIGEGNVGLMRAVCRFDPDRGVRFATYAIWWIRAAMQEFILHNWSLVKMGTTASQKKLFFNLRRMRVRLQVLEEGTLDPEHVSTIATVLGVPQDEVVRMNERMAGPDYSLNVPMGPSGQAEWQSSLADDSDDQETTLAEREESGRRIALLPTVLEKLNSRERHIVFARHLKERPATLDALSRHFGVSRERIRQIESRAMTKLQRTARALATC